MPEFLHLFHRHVAVAMNASLARGENFWAAEQASAVVRGDADDVLDKMAYVVANPTAAGLVMAPQKWPGLITTRLCESHAVRRPELYFRTNGTLPERVALRCTLPAQFQGLDEALVRRMFFAAVAAKVQEARTRLLREGRTFLGVKGVLKQALCRSASTREGLRTKTPRFAISNRDLRKGLIARWRAFVWAHRDALLQGQRDVVFPEGTWAMRVLHGASCRGSDPPSACAA